MMDSGKVIHKSVMLDRCLTLLSPAFANKESSIYLDATLGLGGHAESLLIKFPNLTLVGLDRDKDAIALASARLAQYKERIHIFHATYDKLSDVLDQLKISEVDGILFDLGLSSLQIDDSARGFSYSNPAELDMRMDQSSGKNAADILANYSKEELEQVIREFGEERFARRIATNIVKERSKGRISSTTQLAEIVKESIPAPARRVGGNPAKRTFQALRIEVNQELSILERAIPQALSRLRVGGRMVVMSFHSLEDRIVKRAFSEVCKSKSPINLPIELESHKAKFALLFNGSEKATAEEISENSRAQSVRLRAIERVAA
jgi:16S rRNA (cytosine1402-N4)-methyltransferase